jgi:hypothetical protein
LTAPGTAFTRDDRNVTKLAWAVAPALMPSVRALMTSKDGGRPLLIGSAVLVQYRERRFVVTAGHVLQNWAHRPMYISTGSKWESFGGEWAYLTPPPGTSTLDQWDIASHQLAAGVADELRRDGCRFLVADNPLRFKWPDESAYLGLGWPRRRLKVDWSSHTADPESLAWTSAGAALATYRSMGLHPRDHILLVDDTTEAMRRTGGPLPSFDGMSGGGVFRFPVAGRMSLGAPRLAGILIEHRPKDRLLVAVRIETVMLLIDHDLAA